MRNNYNLRKQFIFYFILFSIKSQILFSQTVQNNSFYYKSKKILFDSGLNWDSLSTFGSFSYNKFNFQYLNNDSLKIDVRFGIQGENEISPYSLGYVTYGNKFYAFFYYPKFIYSLDLFSYLGDSNYTKNQESNNDGNNFSGIGYKSSWLIFQFGKGRESWGAGNDIQLALSENSSAYDYFMLASDYGNLRVNYIHGFLESIDGTNRYITARGIEWTNKKSFIFGFSESVVYSGDNRSLDIGYMNPISSHLEIELNNRLNIIGNENSNAVWQVHLDWLIKENFRLSSNFLIDEFVFDPDIEIGKEHGKAYSIKLAYTPILSIDGIFTTYLSLLFIGTPTFRHVNGYNNFVQKGKPIGSENGSDSRELIFGVNYYYKNFMSFLSVGYFENGSESIVMRPFDPFKDYQASSFPSGERYEAFYLNIDFMWWLKNNLSFITGINIHEKVDYYIGINKYWELIKIY
tara:strand:+ start:33099 stop:34481 length:1383 start_codon:yes stop_codon:yes gene_type:complete